MAIDPQIALGVRSPQINVDIPSPIQQFATVMSLRDMMTRQQMGQMQLQQAQLGLQQAQADAQERQGLADWYRSKMTPAPAAPGAPQAAPWQMSSNDYGEIMAKFPLRGPGIVKGHAEAAKAQLEADLKQHELAQSQLSDAAGLFRGIIDEPSKVTQVGTAFNKGLITPQQRDQYLSWASDDPRWGALQQQVLNAKDAIETGIRVKQEARDKIKSDHDQAMYGPQ